MVINLKESGKITRSKDMARRHIILVIFILDNLIMVSSMLRERKCSRHIKRNTRVISSMVKLKAKEFIDMARTIKSSREKFGTMCLMDLER